MAWRLITRILGVATTLLMARILVPADFGLLAMAATFAEAVDALSQFSLQEALIRRPEDDLGLHDTAFTLQVGRAAVTGIAIALSAPAASRWFDEPRLTPILWTLAALSVVSGWRNIGVVSFRRDMDYGKQFQLLCVPRLIQVAATLPLALLLRSYWALVFGIAIARLAELAVSYVLHPYRPSLSLTGWRELAAFSLWTWAGSIAAILWNRCDPFVIGPVVGPARLGIYLLATQIALLPITELIGPASEALFSGFSLAQKQGTSPLARAMPVATTLLLLVMPVIIVISCTAGYLVAAVLGPAWAVAQPLVAIATWIGLFSPYSYVCGAALIAANHVRSAFVVNCITSAVKVAGLTAVVWVTADLITITTVAVLIVGLEASVFVIALLRAGATGAREAAGGATRIIAAGVATVTLMSATGLPWRHVAMPAWRAVLIGGGLGGGALATFVVLAFTLWHVSGRPEGPEIRAARLLMQFAGPAFQRAISGRIRNR